MRRPPDHLVQHHLPAHLATHQRMIGPWRMAAPAKIDRVRRHVPACCVKQRHPARHVPSRCDQQLRLLTVDARHGGAQDRIFISGEGGALIQHPIKRHAHAGIKLLRGIGRRVPHGFMVGLPGRELPGPGSIGRDSLTNSTTVTPIEPGPYTLGAATRRAPSCALPCRSARNGGAQDRHLMR